MRGELEASFRRSPATFFDSFKRRSRGGIGASRPDCGADRKYSAVRHCPGSFANASRRVAGLGTSGCRLADSANRRLRRRGIDFSGYPSGRRRRAFRRCFPSCATVPVWLRAEDNQPSTFFVGERFPVSLAQFLTKPRNRNRDQHSRRKQHEFPDHRPCYRKRSDYVTSADPERRWFSRSGSRCELCR